MLCSSKSRANVDLKALQKNISCLIYVIVKLKDVFEAALWLIYIELVCFYGYKCKLMLMLAQREFALNFAFFMSKTLSVGCACRCAM